MVDLHPDLVALYAAKVAEKQRHAAALRDLAARACDLQRACLHEHTEHVPDPVGNDSFTRCLTCNAERVRGIWQVTGLT